MPPSSAVLALCDEIRRHRAWNLREPSTNLFQAGSRRSACQSPPKALDEIDVELAKAGAVCLLTDTHDDTLILGQIQRLQWPEYAILIHGIDLDGHTPFVRFSKAVHVCDGTDQHLGLPRFVRQTVKLRRRA